MTTGYIVDCDDVFIGKSASTRDRYNTSEAKKALRKHLTPAQRRKIIAKLSSPQVQRSLLTNIAEKPFSAESWRPLFYKFSEAADVVMELRDKPKTIDKFAAGWKLFSIVQEGFDYDVDPPHPIHRMHNNDEWQLFTHSSEVNKLVIDLLIRAGANALDHSQEHRTYQVDVDDVTFAWVTRDGDDGITGPYILACNDPDHAREILFKLFWEGKEESLVLTPDMGDGNGLRFIPDRGLDDDAFMTQQLRDISGDLQKFTAAGHARGVLLYGPPGTGKTFGARLIARTLGMRTLRLPIGALRRVDINLITDVVRLFRPEVILIDDLDRLHNTSELLDSLEEFRSATKIILATMNNLHVCTPALRRPGRFDRVVKVEKLEEEVVARFVPQEDEVFDKIKAWPLVYIMEYCKIRDVLGKERAHGEIKTLQERQGEAANRYDKGKWNGAGGYAPMTDMDDDFDEMAYASD